ncbi:C45 family autoproteolytic acyltransferase/hydolase [Paenibacillus sp. KN14-4R]|uniref:C45 family autoproteolytic acyltransferase/hydolase n=1 Tax=Paenibacillus sp. KN14-4R TaxID=3445773 RepID=UPI003FA02ECB
MYHPRLQGNHFDMGYKYGSLLYSKGVRFDPVIQLNDDQIKFGSESLSICKNYYPEILEEIKGMAEGVHYPFESFAAFLFNLGVFGEAYGCTCFCFKHGNDIVFARNHDMFSQFKKTTESCLYRPNNGYTFIGQGDALIGKEDGVNEHGLAVGMTFVASKQIKPGFNFLFIVRYLLEKARNVEEAISLLRSLPISTAQNIILADKSGEMAVVECCSQRIVVRRPENEDNFLIATNQFMDPSMSELDHRPESDWYSTQTRYHNVYQSLLKAENRDTLQIAQDILSGKCGFMCQYKKELRFDSLWSFIVRLNDLKILRAEGNPGKTKFEEDTRLNWAIQKG